STIKKYIQEQEKHDNALDKFSVKEYENLLRDNGK
ncbi:Transposase, partial [Streptococcus salivarius K12]